ncbi:MaoC family dehydratase N-terminal domain-containing protein [Cupriavidus sp. 2TAF22]|uniref:FAS1-like dehydratase domain-containing protein n=1 Tax=unclassified Cupriavidus TaxID=2640874 RepID=UPI003F92BB9F
MSAEYSRPGTALPTLDKGALTSSHIVRWCAAQENWDKIHYDRAYARDVADLPDTVINGALKQQFLAQLATSAYGEHSWLWRLACRFRSPDLVGQRLRGEGKVRAVEHQARVTAVHLDLHLFNVDTGSATTEGTATVLLPVSNADKPQTLPTLYIEPREPLQMGIASQGVDENVPASIRRHIGTEIEHIVSFNPVEAGRLRLFAEAVMGLPAYHHDPHAARSSVHGGLVAPALFPVHAMSWPAGAHELDTEPGALGREAVCEVGRTFAKRFSLAPQGLLNGGTTACIHALARPGDIVQASSRLAGVRCRTGRRGERMLVFDTENRYETTAGQLLVHERQTILHRLM